MGEYMTITERVFDVPGDNCSFYTVRDDPDLLGTFVAMLRLDLSSKDGPLFDVQQASFDTVEEASAWALSYANDLTKLWSNTEGKGIWQDMQSALSKSAATDTEGRDG
jgi:hypothetical protein